MFDDLLKFFAHLTVKKLFQCKDNYGHEFGIGAKLKFSGTPDSLTQFVEKLDSIFQTEPFESPWVKIY
jgi:hypothetical protein